MDLADDGTYAIAQWDLVLSWMRLDIALER